MKSLKVRQAAEDDLVEIGVRSQKDWGKAQTLRYMAQLDEKMHLIGANPGLGRACDEVRPGLRRMVAGGHVIFYRVDDDGDAEIVRVLHARMDPVRHVDDDVS